jgi:hypothetical protein
MARTFTCPVPGCGQVAKLVPPAAPFKTGAGPAELIIMPSAMKKEDLQRKPPFEELIRAYSVECPVHGLRSFQEPGHHISTIPKKPSKKA